MVTLMSGQVAVLSTSSNCHIRTELESVCISSHWKWPLIGRPTHQLFKNIRSGYSAMIRIPTDDVNTQSNQNPRLLREPQRKEITCSIPFCFFWGEGEGDWDGRWHKGENFEPGPVQSHSHDCEKSAFVFIDASCTELTFSDWNTWTAPHHLRVFTFN